MSILNFSPGLDTALRTAIVMANECGHEYATLEHLLIAMLDDEYIAMTLSACNADIDYLRKSLMHYLQTDIPIISGHDKDARFSVGLLRAIQRAVDHTRSAGKQEVGNSDILVAIFSESESHALYFLQECGVTRYDTINYLSHGITKNHSQQVDKTQEPETSQSHQEDNLDDQSQNKNPNDKPQKSSTKKRGAIDTYCTNLNEKLKKANIIPLIGRESELTRAIQVLCRFFKNNPLFIGEPGVGKTALVEGLAYRLATGSVPNALASCTIFSLDMAMMLAGSRYRGDFEERFKQLIVEIEATKGAILFIDEIHTIVGGGSTSGSSLDAATLLKPVLSSSEIRCIGATTYRDYRQYLEKDTALLRRFQVIDINEPDEKLSIEILLGLKSRLEKHYQVGYSENAIKHAVKLAKQYVRKRRLPDSAIDIIDEAGAVYTLSSIKKKLLVTRDIDSVVSTMGLTPKLAAQKESDSLKSLEDNLRKVIFGQDNAIQTLVSAIKLVRAGMKDPKKPIGCYLLSGPTGVGKTEVVEQLALLLGISLVRFDMSEYMENHTVSRLIGAPPGYAGFDQGGLLTDSVDQTPNCILLLDEIEKAHHDIYNILLQVMDHGKLTDHNGKQVDFRNTILIMTTNAGAEDMAKSPLGFNRLHREGDDTEAIRRLFKPEFRNRLDSIISFASLSKEHIKMVVNKFIDQLRSQLTHKNVNLNLDDDAIDWLIDKGYDINMGARPMARVIQEHIKKPLAEEILYGKLKKGGSVFISTNIQSPTCETQLQLIFKPITKSDFYARKNKATSDESYILEAQETEVVNLNN